MVRFLHQAGGGIPTRIPEGPHLFSPFPKNLVGCPCFWFSGPMPDEVKGIAVLDERGAHPILFCCCVPQEWPAEEVVTGRIPVRLRGTPETGKTWEYDICGDVIHVTPSLLIETTRPVPGTEKVPNGPMREVELFHNGSDWRVKFVRYDPAVHGPNGAWSLWRKLNAEFFPD